MVVGIAAYLAAINLMAFLAFGSDKRRAQAGARRVPEQTLLVLAVLGGCVGAIAGQQLFRHKTRKEPFRTLLWSIPLVQAAALVGWRLL
jgi:uncharacterized membrane protein YsdA (DUF1294 family)